MGLANLDIWISGDHDPCSVSDRTWFVTIYDCDGRPLRWCRRVYALMPARCGHLSVKLPPGCYRVSAVSHYYQAHGIYWSNWFTHSAIVQVCCDQAACVKLFNPNFHHCGSIFLGAVRGAAAQKLIKPDLARALETSLKQVLQLAPKPAKAFETGHLDEIEAFLKERPVEAEAPEGAQDSSSA
jgi:hypothetical protein